MSAHLTVLDLVPRWMDDAECVGTETVVFFPGRGASLRPAKAVCASCKVRAECLEYALANRIDIGVWGGESERSRRMMRRQRVRSRT